MKIWHEWTLRLRRPTARTAPTVSAASPLVQAREQAALLKLFDAYQELKRLGWNDAIYCPKDGSMFLSIEVGSTGAHRTHYDGAWPTGTWWIHEADDLWPARPVLWKPLESVDAVAKGREVL